MILKFIPILFQDCGRLLFNRYSFHPTVMRRVFPALLMLNLAVWPALTAEMLPNVQEASNVFAYLGLPSYISAFAMKETFPRKLLILQPRGGAQNGHTWKKSRALTHRCAHPSWTCILKQSHPDESSWDTLSPSWLQLQERKHIILQ